MTARWLDALRYWWVDTRRWLACRCLGHKRAAYAPYSWCRRCGENL